MMCSGEMKGKSDICYDGVQDMLGDPTAVFMSLLCRAWVGVETAYLYQFHQTVTTVLFFQAHIVTESAGFVYDMGGPNRKLLSNLNA